MNKIYKAVIIFVIIIAVGYFSLNASCNNKISFTPERIISFLISPFITKAYAFIDTNDKGNYYTYDYHKFKTKDEAVTFCIYSKLGF